MAQTIYNFCIIAHIDHGKSTLADRLLELTGTVDKRHMKEQILDQMDLEREKGITIKLQPVRMDWHGDILNLIDTPGHVDFQYEVSRSLQSVEGAILLVDATQGIQAQTLSNLYLAIDQELAIIPVINKIDLPAADVAGARQEISKLLGVPPADILAVSAKTGEGVEQLLNTIVAKIPPAQQRNDDPFRALIFDSIYDDYRGVVAYVRVVDGLIQKGAPIAFLGSGQNDRVIEAGFFKPQLQAQTELKAGEIGYLVTGLKDVSQARVGDTIVLARDRHLTKPLPGFAVPQPKIFAGLYPEKGEDFPQLREAVSKLKLNDASLTAHQERNEALGQGYRCGFLGLLHLEIVQERLRREHGQKLVITTPSVQYQIKLTDGTELAAQTPAQFPDPSRIATVLEQYAAVEILTPSAQIGPVFELLRQHEGELQRQQQLGDTRTLLEYVLPLRELVVDLYDLLKSATSGYGSLRYSLADWREIDAVKLNLLVNHEPVEALSMIVPRGKAEATGRRMVDKLKQAIPRQLFTIPIQAAIGGKIIARETLPAMRKDVTGYLYGGDVTRKRKLLEKQKKGKKRMATSGSVEIPPSAYLTIFRR